MYVCGFFLFTFVFLELYATKETSAPKKKKRKTDATVVTQITPREDIIQIREQTIEVCCVAMCSLFAVTKSELSL